MLLIPTCPRNITDLERRHEGIVERQDSRPFRALTSGGLMTVHENCRTALSKGKLPFREGVWRLFPSPPFTSTAYMPRASRACAQPCLHPRQRTNQPSFRLPRGLEFMPTAAWS